MSYYVLHAAYKNRTKPTKFVRTEIYSNGVLTPDDAAFFASHVLITGVVVVWNDTGNAVPNRDHHFMHSSPVE